MPVLLDSCFSLYKVSFQQGRRSGSDGCGSQQHRLGVQHCCAAGGSGRLGCPTEGSGSSLGSISASHGGLNSCLGLCSLSPAPECCNSMDSGAQAWAMALRNVQGHVQSASEQHREELLLPKVWKAPWLVFCLLVA